ncbi:MAG: hypothetical protein ABIU54_00970 [Candidatus Eisenbacteria bacterium]
MSSRNWVWCCFVLMALLGPDNANAQWPAAPTVGAPVCTATGSQDAPVVLDDGSGGAWFAWIDRRGGYPQARPYVQHLSRYGTPLLAIDGVAVSSANASTDFPALARRGADGGVIVVWRDFRADTAGNLYAQALSATGELEWAPQGVIVSLGANHETTPVALSDGASGAIVAWRDDRAGSNTDIRAQRLDANGSAMWDMDGVAMGAVPAQRSNPNLAAIPGAPGSVVVGWTELVGSQFNAFVQRLGPDGASQWVFTGVRLSSSNAYVTLQGLTPDRGGGVYATLLDGRSLNTWMQAYVQHVAGNGSVLWAADGVGLSGATWPVYDVLSCTDGSDGVFFTWRAYENNGYHRLFAAHMDSLGGVLASAPVERVGEGSGWLGYSLSPGLEGEALLAWNAPGAQNYAIFAQRIDSAVNRQWPQGGVTLSNSTNVDYHPRVVPDSRGGAIIGWLEYSPTYVSDIYAQRVDRDGMPGTAMVPTPPTAAHMALRVAPMPVRRGSQVQVRWTQSVAGSARVSVLDLSGRRLAELPAAWRGSGECEVTWDLRPARGATLRPGLYLLQVESAGRSASARLVVE